MSTTDQLMKPKRPVRNALIGVGAAVALISGSVIAAGAATTTTDQTPASSSVETFTPEPQITDTYTPEMGVLIDQIEQQAIADAAAAQAAAGAAAAQAAAEAAAQAAAQQQAAQNGPVRCPSGTTANAVDGAGNESNCIANGPGNTQCVAFDENNNCTQYYKP